MREEKEEEKEEKRKKLQGKPEGKQKSFCLFNWLYLNVLGETFSLTFQISYWYESCRN